MLLLTWYRRVNVLGAAKTLALHWCVLFTHCCQIGGEREQCLAHPWSHSHQPEQVHCVRPVSHGEDYHREAQSGASSSHSPNVSPPLLSSLQITLRWQVNSSSLTYNKHWNTVLHGVAKILWNGACAGGPHDDSLYILKGGDPKRWEFRGPAKSVLMSTCFLKSKSKTCLQVTS